MSIPNRVRSLPILAMLAAVATLHAGGPAQTVIISGSISDGSGGPLLGGAVHHAVSHLLVPAGATLTVQAGAIIKFGSQVQLEIQGTLIVNGTVASPAVFTSIQDDSAGGDTNGNGPSSGAPADWRGLIFQSNSDASTLNRAVIRYTGAFGLAGLTLNQADITLHGCSIASCAFDGMNLANQSRPSVADCTITGNGGIAVNQASLDALPGFFGNTATGNAVGDSQNVTSGTLAGSVTIGPSNLLGGVFVLAGNVVVPAGLTLTLQAGTIVKLRSSNLVLDIYGTLVTQGTASMPVVFTAFSDDDHGGDTNRNGPSAGSPASWLGMRFYSTSDASVLDRLVVRYAGNAGLAGMRLNQSNLVMRNCLIQSCLVAPLDLGLTSFPTVARCSFLDNGGTAIIGVPLDAVPGLLRNTASGNAGGDFVNVAVASPAGNCVIGPSNLINGVLVFSLSCVIPAGVTVTFEQGVIVKFRANNLGFFVNGGLNLLGTAFEPVVFTSYADDQHGGDTNQDGPSTGSRNDWLGTILYASPTLSLLEHALFRFGGNAGYPALQNSSSQCTIRSVRAELCGSGGFFLFAHAAVPANNLVAFDCLGDGIQLGAGTFDVQFATSVRNGLFGFHRLLPYQGFVTNSISWSNASNFGGFHLGQVVNCNGDQSLAGTYGNVFVVPGFVFEAAGDLHLTHNCPMVDQGDVGASLAVVKDHDENSRILDDDINSVAVPDLGAYELAWWDMTVSGLPRLGDTLSFTVQGAAGTSIFALGALDGVVYTQPFGFYLLGTQPLILAALPVGTPLVIQIPDDPALIGLVAGLQTLTFPPTTTAFGSVTRLYRARIRA